MDKLKGWDNLFKEIEQKKEKDKEPFWRPKTKERSQSSGIRLGSKVL